MAAARTALRRTAAQRAKAAVVGGSGNRARLLPVTDGGDRIDRTGVALRRDRGRSISRKAAGRRRPNHGGLSQDIAHQTLAEGDGLSLRISNIECGDPYP